MENRSQIEQELAEIGVNIAASRFINPYRVPAGYFDALPGQVLSVVTTGAFLDSARTQPFRVPAGYFEGLAADVLGKIKTREVLNEVREELEEVAPLLNTISRNEVYKVPAGYFESAGFATAMAGKKEGKVITLRIARKWMQYAAAAVMAGVLVMSAFVFTGNGPKRDDGNIVTSEMNAVSEGDLEKYLDNPEHFVAAPAATSFATESDLAYVKTNIAQLSDDELNQYLSNNAEPFEPAVSEKE